MSLTRALKEISFVTADSSIASDVYCTHCPYYGNILVRANWLTYKNPNYDAIVRFHQQYIKWLDLCPKAIEYVLGKINTLCCPKCAKTRLHISHASTYHPDWIRCSLNCHEKD